MNIILYDYTHNGSKLVALAMRFSRSYNPTNETFDDKKIEHLINLAFKSGHMSVFEHIKYTFGIIGISRSCSLQFVRHRHMSFVQFSQRYSKEQYNFVMPDVHPSQKFLIDSAYNRALEIYYTLLNSGVKAEDARFVLPEGTATSLIVTANAREWMHFLKLRRSLAAQWEIREVANNIFNKLNEIEPLIFNEEVFKYYEG